MLPRQNDFLIHNLTARIIVAILQRTFAFYYSLIPRLWISLTQSSLILVPCAGWWKEGIRGKARAIIDQPISSEDSNHVEVAWYPCCKHEPGSRGVRANTLLDQALSLKRVIGI